MALQNRQKNRLRQMIRVAMVTIALLMVFWAVVLPILNNGIALGVEKDLKALPMPEKTTRVDSISAAGRFSSTDNEMQYFGAILIESSLSETELEVYFGALYDCTVEKQSEAAISPKKMLVPVTMDLAFDEEPKADGYYIVYAWGQAPEWAKDLLDTDMR